MSQERKQVLDMLAAGKITADEAERLLDKLERPGLPARGGPPGGTAPPGAGSSGSAGDSAPARTGQPKYLRVVVSSKEGDQVNIRVPLALVRTGIKLSTMLPSEADEKLRAKGIDLSQFSGLEGEELVEALRELTVDVDSAKGDVVRVFCE